MYRSDVLHKCLLECSSSRFELFNVVYCHVIVSFRFHYLLLDGTTVSRNCDTVTSDCIYLK